MNESYLRSRLLRTQQCLNASKPFRAFMLELDNKTALTVDAQCELLLPASRPDLTIFLWPNGAIDQFQAENVKAITELEPEKLADKVKRWIAIILLMPWIISGFITGLCCWVMDLAGGLLIWLAIILTVLTGSPLGAVKWAQGFAQGIAEQQQKNSYSHHN